MDEPQTQTGNVPLGRKVRRAAWIVWLTVERVFDILMDALADYFHIMVRETELFLGTALLLIGVLDFQNGKNCDGNTADYISCTNPSTFYYYNWLEITLIVIGVFLVMLWVLKLRSRATAQR